MDTSVSNVGRRKPDWLKNRIGISPAYRSVRSILSNQHLNTVCEEAHCPNLGECWNLGTATFLILGNTCTRNCRFCAVSSGIPNEYDQQEPLRVAEAVKAMNIRHAVITSVTRDDLPDGGAGMFAECISIIRQKVPGCTVEVLIPDFQGDDDALEKVFAARPDILNHNLETVPRLYNVVRPKAVYGRSLETLRKAASRGLVTKTGLMVGLGERLDEIEEVMRQVLAVGCKIITIGQYLQPTQAHRPVDRYVHPDEFELLKQKGMTMGYRIVESAPLVRSSYHAEKHV
jgi:lipoic acid synthetase